LLNPSTHPSVANPTASKDGAPLLDQLRSRLGRAQDRLRFRAGFVRRQASMLANGDASGHAGDIVRHISCFVRGKPPRRSPQAPHPIEKRDPFPPRIGVRQPNARKCDPAPFAYPWRSTGAVSVSRRTATLSRDAPPVCKQPASKTALIGAASGKQEGKPKALSY